MTIKDLAIMVCYTGEMKKVLIGIVLLFVTWGIVHVGVLLFDGLIDAGKSADVAVVLGNKVNTDGTLSPRLKARTDHAARLYQEKRIGKIIVSGGLGVEGHYEGTAMKAYLVEQGIPEDAIVADNQGINTEATVENVMKLKQTENFDSVIVVSQYFHILRSKYYFNTAGMSQVYGSAPWYFEWRDIYSILREVAAFYF
jgi:vancomycin permeability regulator SanA